MKKVSLFLALIMLVSAFSAVFPESAAYADGNRYTVSENAFENMSMHVGSDESERNFIWHSDSNEGYVEYAVRDGNTFPENYTSVQTRVTLSTERRYTAPLYSGWKAIPNTYTA